MNFHFDNTEEFLDFLFNAKDVKEGSTNDLIFVDWEVLNIHIISKFGADLGVNTKSVDASGERDYIQWGKLKDMVSIFLEQNGDVGSTIDLRFKVPRKLKDAFDPLNEYESFNLGFYNGVDVTVLIATAVERKLPANYEPYNLWVNYIQTVLGSWRSAYEDNKRQIAK